MKKWKPLRNCNFWVQVLRMMKNVENVTFAFLGENCENDGEKSKSGGYWLTKVKAD